MSKWGLQECLMMSERVWETRWGDVPPNDCQIPASTYVDDTSENITTETANKSAQDFCWSGLDLVYCRVNVGTVPEAQRQIS